MKGEKKLESMERVKSRMQASRILLDLNGGRSPDCNIDSKQSITELISDSRRVTPGSAFFALPGLRSNGNEYVQEALDRGARAIITEDPSVDVPLSVAKICVNDARKTLAKYSKRYYGSPDEHLDLVGVTGTNGKTSIVQLIFEVFQHLGFSVGKLSTITNAINEHHYPATHTTPDPMEINSFLAKMVDAGV